MAEEGPVGPEAIAAAQQLAQQLLEIEKIQGNIKTQSEAELFVKQQTLVAQKEELKLIADAKVNGDEIVANLNEEIRLLKLKAAEGEKISASDQAQIDALNEQIDAVRTRQSLSDDYVNTLRETSAALEQNLQKTTSLKDTIGTAASALTGIGDGWKASATGAFLSTAQTEGFAAAISAAGEGLKETFTAENIAGSLLAGVVQQTMKAVVGLDNARAAVSKSLGTGDQYDAVVTQVYQDTQVLGVSSDEAAQAIIGLSQNMAGFGQMSRTAQADLAGFAATMAEVGVDAGTTGQFLTNTTKIMGLSASQSKALGAELGGLASTLGVSLGQITSDFNSVMGDLAIYGKEAPQVFKKLAGASAALGISVDSLVGSMKELDTISGAAAKAGKLNAVLGGQFFDTNELLNASYEERVMLLKEGIDQSGKDFESMSRAEKQMLAQAAGLKDTGELAKIMNTSMSDLTKSMEDAGNATGSMDDMKDKAQQAQSAQERLQQALESLAVAIGPLTDALGFVADIFASLVQNPIVKWLMIAAGAAFFMVKAVFAIRNATLAVQGALAIAKAGLVTDTALKYGNASASGAMTTGNKTAAASGMGFIGFLKALLQAIQPNIPALLALGFTFLMIGAAIAIAAYGVSLLVASFAGFSAGEILAISVALLVFGLTIVGIAIVLLKAIPLLAGAAVGLAVFGGVMLLLGVAILLAAFAFSLFVDSFLLLLPHLPQFALFAVTLLLLAVAAMLMLPGGIMGMIGLILLSVGLIALALALLFVPSDDLRSLADMMMGLGMVAQFAGAGISDAVPAVEELFDMLSEMSLQLMMSVGLFQTLGNAFYDMGWGAMMAALFLPALVVPLMLIGTGVVIWSEAMASLNTSLSTFFTFIPQWYEVLTLFTLLVPLIMMMAFAIMMLATFGVQAFFGLLMISIGLDYVAESLYNIWQPTIEALVGFIDKLSSLTDEAINRLYDLGWAMWWLGEVTWGFPTWTFMSFSHSLDTVGDAAQKLEVLTDQKVSQIVEVVDAAREYSELDLATRYTAMFGYGNEFERLLDKIGSALGTRGGGSGSGSGGSSTVVLELDGKELGRTVETLLGKRNKLTTSTS
jgi:hypothetical protein